MIQQMAAAAAVLSTSSMLACGPAWAAPPGPRLPPPAVQKALDAALSNLFRTHPDLSLYFFDQCLMNPCIIFVLKKLLSLGANGTRLFAQPSLMSPNVDREIACARQVQRRHVPQFRLIHPFSERTSSLDADPRLAALFC